MLWRRLFMGLHYMVNPLVVFGIALLLAVGETVFLWSQAIRKIGSTEGILVVFVITILFWSFVGRVFLKALRAWVLLREADMRYEIDFGYIFMAFLLFIIFIFIYLLILLIFSMFFNIWLFLSDFIVFFIVLSILHVLEIMLESMIYSVTKSTPRHQPKTIGNQS